MQMVDRMKSRYLLLRLVMVLGICTICQCLFVGKIFFRQFYETSGPLPCSLHLRKPLSLIPMIFSASFDVKNVSAILPPLLCPKSFFDVDLTFSCYLRLGIELCCVSPFKSGFNHHKISVFDVFLIWLAI